MLSALAMSVSRIGADSVGESVSLRPASSLEGASCHQRRAGVSPARPSEARPWCCERRAFGAAGQAGRLPYVPGATSALLIAGDPPLLAARGNRRSLAAQP